MKRSGSGKRELAKPQQTTRCGQAIHAIGAVHNRRNRSHVVEPDVIRRWKNYGGPPFEALARSSALDPDATMRFGSYMGTRTPVGATSTNTGQRTSAM
jgi:hypothetical protein